MPAGQRYRSGCIVRPGRMASHNEFDPLVRVPVGMERMRHSSRTEPQAASTLPSQIPARADGLGALDVRWRRGRPYWSKIAVQQLVSGFAPRLGVAYQLTAEDRDPRFRRPISMLRESALEWSHTASTAAQPSLRRMAMLPFITGRHRAFRKTSRELRLSIPRSRTIKTSARFLHGTSRMPQIVTLDLQRSARTAPRILHSKRATSGSKSTHLILSGGSNPT